MKTRGFAIGSAIGIGVTAIGFAASKLIRLHRRKALRDIDEPMEYEKEEDGPDDPGFYGTEPEEDYLSALTEDENEEGTNPTLSVYTYGYNDGFEDGYNTAVAERIRAENQYGVIPPEADDDLLPFDREPMEEDNDLSFSKENIQEEDREWPCIDELKNVAVFNPKDVRSFILSYIPFSHSKDDAAYAAAGSILDAVLGYVKAKRKSSRNKHANSYSYAFSLIRSLQEGSISLDMILSDAAYPEKIEKDLQPFISASMEDKNQALYNICLVLPILDPKKVIELARPGKKKVSVHTSKDTAEKKPSEPEPAGESNNQNDKKEEVTNTVETIVVADTKGELNATLKDVAAKSEYEVKEFNVKDHIKSAPEEAIANFADADLDSAQKDAAAHAIKAMFAAMKISNSNDLASQKDVQSKLEEMQNDFQAFDKFVSESGDELAMSELALVKAASSNLREKHLQLANSCLKQYIASEETA